MIRAIIAEPGKKARTVRIKNDLENLQKIIGGVPEVLRLGDGMAAVCDENGKLKNLPFAGIFKQYFLVGTVVLVGIDSKGFTDFPMTLPELRKVPGFEFREC